MDGLKLRLKKKDQLLLLIFICGLAFWVAGNMIDLYKFAVTGALFEILWLPMLLILFGIPMVFIFCWAKEKFSLKVVYPYLIVMMVSAILVLQYLFL